MRRIAPAQVVAMVRRALTARRGEAKAEGIPPSANTGGELFATIASLAERAG
jgi:hypothetical protein